MKIQKFRLMIAPLLFACLSWQASASVFLPIGAGPLPLPGTTAAAETDLAGTVIHDKLIPFQITNGLGSLLFEGTLQNRVVKSSADGTLHFYYYIRNTRPGLNGIVGNVMTSSFATSRYLAVDWRPDGLGQVRPLMASRNAGTGNLVRFTFPTAVATAAVGVLVGGRESKFFYLKTKVMNFKEIGQTRIQLTTGQFVTLQTMAPVL